MTHFEFININKVILIIINHYFGIKKKTIYIYYYSYCFFVNFVFQLLLYFDSNLSAFLKIKKISSTTMG